MLVLLRLLSSTLSYVTAILDLLSSFGPFLALLAGDFDFESEVPEGCWSSVPASFIFGELVNAFLPEKRSDHHLGRKKSLDFVKTWLFLL